jgi:hypothetical protein
VCVCVCVLCVCARVFVRTVCDANMKWYFFSFLGVCVCVCLRVCAQVSFFFCSLGSRPSTRPSHPRTPQTQPLSFSSCFPFLPHRITSLYMSAFQSASNAPHAKLPTSRLCVCVRARTCWCACLLACRCQCLCVSLCLCLCVI